jgi:hypothetical protein
VVRSAGAKRICGHEANQVKWQSQREPGSADRKILSAGLLDTPIEITGNGALDVRGLPDEAKIQKLGS